MPRLSTNSYLVTHDYLRDVWLRDGGAFAYMAPADQRYLHDYFVPSRLMTTSELRAHRQRVSKEQPSLPQQAGRAYARLTKLVKALVRERRRAATPAKRPTGTRARATNVRVYSQLRPEPDIQKLVAALMHVAEQQARQAQEDRDHEEAD